MGTKIIVQIDDRYNNNPDNGPLGHTGYTAIENYPYSAGWKGCPLGRSSTKSGAVADLLRRANYESGTNVTFDDVNLKDTSSGPEG